MPHPLGLALVGFGKIARDQHLAAIAATPALALRAIVSRSGQSLPGTDTYYSVADLLERAHGIDAVAFCNPAAGRRTDVELALRAGRHVLLEKPPVAALAEMAPLLAVAAERRATLFAAWHSRFGLGVESARATFAGAALRSVAVEWREDVRVWHPRQDWIWEPAGLGVFDPGINALSILTRILPRPFALRAATLHMPANRATPIAAELAYTDTIGVPIGVTLDFRHVEPRIWTIRVETEQGNWTLSDGGHLLTPDRDPTVPNSIEPPFAGLSPHEYPGLYRHFVALIETGRSDADLAPLLHVADALMLGHRRPVEPFDDDPAPP